MPTHDYVIDNQSSVNARADINNALQAILTNNSSATAPTTTSANMLWYDTANNLLRMRNEADTDWIVVGYLNQANNQMEVRTDVIQAASASGTAVKNSSGTTLLTLEAATKATAEAGTNNDQLMTPLRVKEAIEINATSIDFGDIGTYALLFKTSNGNITAAATYSGSLLRPASFGRNSWNGNSVQSVVVDYVSNVSVSGNWRAMGGSDNFANISDIATLFLRIS